MATMAAPQKELTPVCPENTPESIVIAEKDQVEKMEKRPPLVAMICLILVNIATQQRSNLHQTYRWFDG
eukprot:Skav213979  [mRNA]  locus=scaffold2200:476864:477070:- [translate_table: standard]